MKGKSSLGGSRRRIALIATVFAVAAIVAAIIATQYVGKNRLPERLRSTPTEHDSGHPGAGAGEPSEDSKPAAPVDSSPLAFVLMSETAGVDFTYYGAPSPQAFMTEQNGGGVALFDYDGDGTLDTFLVNGSHFQHPAEEAQASNRLYRATGTWQFADVTPECGLTAFGHGMGCAAADYDNDGFTDLYVTYYGRNRLWRNNGDGTFSETTHEAGVGDEAWGTSAAFADFDNDGNLDLYVVNYVDWSPTEPACHPPGRPEMKIVCSPVSRTAQPDLLYRNLGDGRFEEAASAAGIVPNEDAKGLAVAVADLNGDGRLDIYVANDTTRNFLYENRGDWRFEETGIRRGVALSSDGRAGAGMGIACGDFDRNGLLDLCVTNFANQINDVFANHGSQGFFAVNAEVGVDIVSRQLLGFGIVLADFDLDGWPDLFAANGHIWDLTAEGTVDDYRMGPTLLRNQSGTRFVPAMQSAGDYFQQRWLGRAVAFGDLDNDGDVDLVVTHLEDPPALLRNDSRRSGEALRLKFIGTRSARQPLGTRVEAFIGEERFVTHVPSGGSFQASHDDRVLIAVGNAAAVSEVRVFWPGGAVERWQDVPVGKLVRLIEGTGETVERDKSCRRIRQNSGRRPEQMRSAR